MAMQPILERISGKISEDLSKLNIDGQTALSKAVDSVNSKLKSEFNLEDQFLYTQDHKKKLRDAIPTTQSIGFGLLTPAQKQQMLMQIVPLIVGLPLIAKVAGISPPVDLAVALASGSEDPKHANQMQAIEIIGKSDAFKKILDKQQLAEADYTAEVTEAVQTLGGSVADATKKPGEEEKKGLSGKQWAAIALGSAAVITTVILITRKK
jgi:hypothetical protein